MTKEDQIAYDIVRKLFRDDYGNPFLMTLGQIKLFRSIYEKQHPRTQFECYTQYGKSDVVSMAILLRATTFPEKWIILGASKDKAGIIMSKVIKHLFESDYILSKFEIGADETVESLKRNRAKDHISFKVDERGNMGEIIVLSGDARRKSADAGDILIGHGGQNLIEDDAALIPDAIHGKALRMLGGHKNNFLLKITNSFGRNHAYRSSIDPHFFKVTIDYQQGLAEGRLTPEYIDEMKSILDPVMFGILYECKYPPADMVEDGGWMTLLTEDQIEDAQKRVVQSKGYKKFGIDVSEGTNFNAFVVRTDNRMFVKEKSLEKDLMKTADRAAFLMRDEVISSEYTFIDAVAIGAGVASRLHQMGLQVNAIKAGDSPTEKSEAQQKLDPIAFYNLRAEMYWKLRDWVLQGGALEPHRDWIQLSKIRYREASSKTIQIMPKQEMRVRGLISASESPDVADAASLTFAPSKIIFVQNVASVAVKPYYPEIQGSNQFGGASTGLDGGGLTGMP